MVAKPKGTARKRDLAEGSKRSRIESVRTGIQELSLEEEGNTAKRLKTTKGDVGETEEGRENKEREVIIVRRKVEISLGKEKEVLDTKTQGNAGEDAEAGHVPEVKEGNKPKTFTQLSLREILARKPSWNTSGNAAETPCNPGKKETGKRKRKPSGSPKSPGSRPKRKPPGTSPGKETTVNPKLGDSGKQGNLTPVRKMLCQESLVTRNIKILEKKVQQEKQQEKKKENKEEKKNKTKIDRKQKLLTQFILTKPRASHQATSGGSIIKEECSSRSVGRGEGENLKERKGDKLSLGIRQDPSIGSQEIAPSPGRARPRKSEEEERTQVSKEDEEGAKGSLHEVERPGNKERKEVWRK